MRKLISMLLIIFHLLYISGCTYYTAGRFPSKNIEHYDNKQTKDNLTVGVKFLNRQEVADTFRRDMLGQRIQPLFVIIENNSTNAYYFNEDNCSERVYHADTVGEKLRFTQGFRMFFLMISYVIWPLLIITVPENMSATRGNEMMVKDYASKELFSGDISSNSTVAGFLYLDRLENSLEPITLTLENKDTKKGIKFTFNKR